MMQVDDLLCNATEAQLRNVLAMVRLPDAELVALFSREQKMAAKESALPANVVFIR
jgi:hypothetical protein